MIKAGDLDRQITFQQRTRTQDADTGAWNESGWANIATNPTVWAQVQDVLSAEKLDDSVSMVNRPARVRCRYRDDITSDMRISYEGRLMQITSGPIELGRREGLQMICTDYSTEGDAA